MPQMSPMNWLFLMMLFIIFLILVVSMLNFFYKKFGLVVGKEESLRASSFKLVI